MEKELPKAKIRIKTLNPNLTVIDDRLVDQNTEFRNGPKEKHKGPITLEVTLRDKLDHSEFIKYLNMLLGDLPIVERKVYKRQKEDGPAPEPIEELLAELKKNCKDQEQMINYLRERSFVFCTSQYIRDMQLPITFHNKTHEEFDYMIRRTKLGKVPSSDKYDPRLAIGFKIRGDKDTKVPVYVDGLLENGKSWKMPWPEKLTINYKKIALTIFPHYMTEEERERWRKEHRKLLNNPGSPESKFYSRWKDAIKQPELPPKL